MNKNRGMLLETIINKTINYYADNEIAYIEKKGLPIKFSSVNKNLNLFNAHIYKKSTVDYVGCYQGKFLAFEAKSTDRDSLPCQNIASHQKEYLIKIHKNKGLAFFIVFFNNRNEFYIVNALNLISNLKKSISYEKIKNIGFRVNLSYPGIIDFLPYVNHLF